MARASHEHRKPPVGAVLRLHKQGVRGLCGWCGGNVTETTPARGWFKFWHSECSFEMGVIEQPALARDAVRDRDKCVCADCGNTSAKVKRTWNGKNLGPWDYETETWQVDHKVPLWKVAHLPPLERIEYFKLANLITRCEDCHKKKTKAEAAERAHFRRLSEPEKQADLFRKTIQSRGFDKQHRPMSRPHYDNTKRINADLEEA